MKKLLGNTLAIAILILAFTPMQALADPTISRTSGTFAHGLTVTITGTGFGTKNPAKPLVWADFEQGLAPSKLGISTSWKQVQNMEWSTECPADAVGTKCAKASNSDGAWTIAIDYANWTNEGQKVYIYKIQRKNFLITNQSQNWKMWRMWPAGSAGNYPNIYAAPSNGRVYVEKIGQESGFWGGFRTGTTNWVNEELIFQASSAINVKDGVLNIRYDGRKKASGTVLTRSTSAPAYMKRNYVVHGVPANKSRWNPNWTNNNRVWVDDVYVDTTWARVILCNSENYSGCTKLAPQIPSAWSAQSITITVNQGPIQDLANAYLYVIDANGNVNPFGFPIPTDPAPEPPKNLRIQ